LLKNITGDVFGDRSSSCCIHSDDDGDDGVGPDSDDVGSISGNVDIGVGGSDGGVHRVYDVDRGVGRVADSDAGVDWVVYIYDGVSEVANMVAGIGRVDNVHDGVS